VKLNHYQQNLSALLLVAEIPELHKLMDVLVMPPGTSANPSEHTLQRLGIYRNNVLYSLSQAMAAQFPIVKKLVGDNFFFALARDYIREQPPHEPSLTFYGDTFPAFIAEHEHCQVLPYLPDVATLEWQCQKTLHAADAPVLTTEQLSTIDPSQLGELTLSLQPGATLMCSDWPIDRIWRENLGEEANTIDLNVEKNAGLLIYRRQWQATVVCLIPSAYCMLARLNDGHSISKSWEQAQATYTLADDELGALLVYLVGLDVFSGFTLTNTEGN